MAHRGVFVHQSSQASASHLIGGVIRALNSRRPAVLNIYTPCPVEHGLADEWAPRAAKLALECRAFPFLTYDPDGGPDLADCLSLEGNPAVDDVWPTYELEYVDDDGEPASMELPVTTADWAATEVRFRRNFEKVDPSDWGDDMVPFHDFMVLDEERRIGKRPFIWTLDADRRRERMQVSAQMVTLAEDRLSFWHQLREIAGLDVSTSAHDAVEADLEVEFDTRLDALRAEYEKRISDLEESYPRAVARKMAEGLLEFRGGNATVAEILLAAETQPGLQPIGPAEASFTASLALSADGATAEPSDGAEREVGAGSPGTAIGAATLEPADTLESAEKSASATASAPSEEEDDDDFARDPWIETARCTTCNECTNLNGRMFAYDSNKQAYFKDPLAGTFAQIVQAAERCPAGIIHPGDPLNPKEKDLEKWVARAQPFN